MTQEEALIDEHKRHVNEVINCEKEEMGLITEVDKSGSDVEEYVGKLDRLLLQKMQMIMGLRKNLLSFGAHLQMEKNLQQLYQERQRQMSSDEEDNRDEMIMGGHRSAGGVSPPAGASGGQLSPARNGQRRASRQGKQSMQL